jgi:UDP-N-acetylglucosamine 4,6-dehydratase
MNGWPMRSVLVTGGSGFFGRGFARRALDLGCERVCILSRGEYAQHLMRQEFDNDSRLRFFVGDVRDLSRVRRAMEDVEVVVHAAALKRVEVGEYDSEEMAKTNVIGAINVIEASRDAKVRKVVALSTDKAFEPVNAYGASKLLAEKLFLAANASRGARGPIYAVTRYGNVAGSTGSVIPTWRAAAAASDPIVITDRECTRFWMTLDEAVDLVLTTIRTMKGGELRVPDLPAYRLGDLLTAMKPPESALHVKGIGPGEKMHEGMAPGITSDKARRMSVDELREALRNV